MYAKNHTQTTGAMRALPASRPVPVMGRMYADVRGPGGLVSRPLAQIPSDAVVTVTATIAAVNRLSGDRANLILSNRDGDTALVTLCGDVVRLYEPLLRRGQSLTIRGVVTVHTAGTATAKTIEGYAVQAAAL